MNIYELFTDVDIYTTYIHYNGNEEVFCKTEVQVSPQSIEKVKKHQLREQLEQMWTVGTKVVASGVGRIRGCDPPDWKRGASEQDSPRTQIPQTPRYLVALATGCRGTTACRGENK